MKRKLLVLLVICSLVLTFLSGCSQNQGNKDNSNGEEIAGGEVTANVDNPLIKNKDEVVISLATELQTLDILGQQNIVTNEVLTNIYDTLLTLNDDGSIGPNIATSWEWIEDEIKYRFYIKEGIKFHDATELKASDVVFSFKLITDEFQSYRANVANQIKDVKLVDDYTLDVYLNEPSAIFLYNCSIDASIYSEKAYETLGGFKENIVSCGPYRLVSYNPTTGAVLEAFEDYHGEIKPKIKKATFKIIPDANTQVAALETGELNISRDFPMISLKSIEEDPNLYIYSHDCGLVNFLLFNLRPNGAEELKNQKVRQAINYCLDKDFMIEVAEEGLATPARSIANMGMFGYSEKIPFYEHDMEKAKQLMKEAGYENGFNLGTMITRDGKAKKIAEVAQENLKEINIDVDIQVLENNAFIDDLMSGNYIIASTHLNLSSDGDNALDCISKKGAIPFAGIEDEWIEEQNILQKRELDIDKRFNILESILVRTGEEAYFAPIYYPKKNYAVTKGLKINGYHKFVGLQLKYLEWEE